MRLKFMEYNNKYLKCLATVRLINKLFNTTPQYIEEKTFSGFNCHATQSTSESFRQTQEKALQSIHMSMAETLRLILSRVTK